MTRPQGLRISFGHLALLAVICIAVIAYLLDARATSLKPNNLLLVQPAALLALVLIAMVIPQCFRRATPDTQTNKPKETWGDLAKVGALIAAFISLALMLDVVGFDLATFWFMVVALFLCGERNWLLKLGYSAVFTVLLIYGYGAIIPFPFPLTVL